MILDRIVLGLSIAVLWGCGGTMSSAIYSRPGGLSATASSYVPLDPLSVSQRKGRSCYENNSAKQCSLDGNCEILLKELRKALPDQTVRMAVAQYNSNGTVSYGPASVGFEGNSYQIILDYMNTDTSRAIFNVRRKIVIGGSSGGYTSGRIPYEFRSEVIDKDAFYEYDVIPIETSEIFTQDIDPNISDQTSDSEENSEFKHSETFSAWSEYESVSFPVYVGVGLRLTANITVLEGRVNLSGLPAIAAEAAAGRLTGSIIVQTLGITGEKISNLLPLPSELNQATIQNSVLALGAIKALLSDDETELTPRVVGLFNPLGGDAGLVNSIVSELSKKPLFWHRPCGRGEK